MYKKAGNPSNAPSTEQLMTAVNASNAETASSTGQFKDAA